ncbi:MAG: hypothetical protein ABW122_16875 [Ilumatobacteraceae bacterium]
MSDPTDTNDDDAAQEVTDDQILEDAEGGIEGSLLDAPDDPGIAPV